MYDRTAIMKAAWRRYRAAYGSYKTFFRECFREALRLEWKAARFAVEHAEEQAHRDREHEERRTSTPTRFMGEVIQPATSELEERIDVLKYLSFRHDIGRMERDIRAQHAAATRAA